MSENFAGLVKIIGISVLLVLLWGIMWLTVPDKFMTTGNVENLLRRTALYGVLGIGVAFVIISSGIDLSIGSLVCLAGCMFALFVSVSYEPMEQVDVWRVDYGNKEMLVKSDQFQEGDEVWFYRDRNSKGAVRITAVDPDFQVDGKSYHRLQFEGELRGKQVAETKVIGQLSPTYEINSLQKESELLLEENAPAIRTRDKVRFVHLSNPTKERAVVVQKDSRELMLESPVSDITDGYRVVPIERSPLMSIPMALVLVIAISLGIGLIHGVLITRFKQQPFIITLCGLLIYRSIARRLTNDQPVGFNEYSDSLGAFASGRWVIWGEGAESFGIPYSFFFLAILTVLSIIFINYTIWGRYLMALGRNEEAARYSGINTGAVTMMAYVLCAGLAGVGGILHSLDTNSVPPSSFGNFFELYAIAAAVLGGCSLRGGEGSILGVVVGTALMQTLYNSTILLGIPDTLELAIIGVVILVGVVSDELVRKVAGRIRQSSPAS